MNKVKADLVNKYRQIAKDLGVWDATYATIKQDLPYIRAHGIDMATAYDLAGAFSQMVLLGLRLLTYGESNTDLTKEDVELIMTPMVELYSDTEFAGRLNTDSWGLIKSVFPMVSELVKEKKITDPKELEKHLRMIFIHSTHLFNIVLGRMMATDYCLVRYGMTELRDWMSEEAMDVLDKSGSSDVVETRKRVSEIFKSTANFAPNRFIINMSILLNETNVGEIDYRKTTAIMAGMDAGIIARGHEHDCLEFMEGPGFMDLAHNVLRFHNVEASQLYEDD